MSLSFHDHYRAYDNPTNPNPGRTGMAWFRFGCGSPGCDCLRDAGPSTHPKVYWTFLANPATQFEITPTPDIIDFRTTGSSNGRLSTLRTKAIYGDGYEAPFAKSTELTFTASSPYGSLSDGQQRGQTIKGVPYRDARAGYVKFIADGNTGGGTATDDGPPCDLDVPVFVSGGGISGEGTVTIRGSGPPPPSDTLIIIVTPSSIAPGDSAQVFARFDMEQCTPPPSDTTRMAVAAVPGLYGELSYNGKRSPIFTNVPYGDLKNGEVRLIADGDIPCEDDTMTVLVEGDGRQGYAEVIIEGLNAQGRGTETSCVSFDWPDLTEEKQSIKDWHAQNCSAQIATAPPHASTLESFTTFSYERDLARYLFGGMGWGVIQEYPRSLEDGVDGYLRWYTDESGNPTNYVSTIFESKLRETPPIADFPRDSSQAIDAIDFLGDQYDAWLSSPTAPVGAVGGPILIYSSQSSWDDHGDGQDWWLGYHEPVNNRIIAEANERGVLLLHAKVVHVPGTSYRYVKVKFMNKFSLLDTNVPGLSWLLRRASTFDLSRWTFHTFLPFGYDCDEVGGTPGDDQDSPLPPS